MGSIALALCSCAVGNGAYTRAASALVSNAAAAGANRAATGECLAVCSFGTQCNRDSGLCEPMKAAEARAPVVEEQPSVEVRCANANRDWSVQSLERGPRHPDMITLRAVIETCQRFADPPPPCAPQELDVVELEAGGLGARHPEVLAAQQRLSDCRAKLEALR